MNSEHKNGDIESSAQGLFSTHQGDSQVASRKRFKVSKQAGHGLVQEVLDLSNTDLGIGAGIATGTPVDALTLEGQEADTGYATVYYADSRCRKDLQAVDQGTLATTLELLEFEAPITASLDATAVEKTSQDLLGNPTCSTKP